MLARNYTSEVAAERLTDILQTLGLVSGLQHLIGALDLHVGAIWSFVTLQACKRAVRKSRLARAVSDHTYMQ